MSNVGPKTRWQHRMVCLLMVAVLCSGSVLAQLSPKRLKYDGIAARYSGEHAVYTEVTQRIVIEMEGNELIARGSGVLEKLFLSEKSLNTANREHLSDNYFVALTDADGVTFMPEKNDYRVDRNGAFIRSGGYYYTGLAKGAITKTNYSTRYADVRSLFPFSFERDLPIVKAKLEVVAPVYVKMNFLVMGANTEMIQRVDHLRDGLVTYTFEAENVPAYKHIDHVPSPLYYVAHVIPSVTSFRLTGADKDSLLTGSTDIHHKFEYAYVRGLNLKTDSFLNKKTAELTKYAYSDRDKAEKIYNWVQKNMHYYQLDFGLEGLIPRPADTVFKRKYGDCKDMASIIMAMCRKAGVSAYFTAIGSKNKPYTHEQLQSEYIYDHMICATKLNGEWVFLDGTTDNLPFGYNRKDLQGKEAYIMIDDYHYEIVKIPETPASENVHTDNTVMNISGDEVSGTISRHYTGYRAWDLADAFDSYTREEERDKLIDAILQRGNNKFNVKKYDVNVSGGRNKTTSINARYSMGGYARKVSGRYYVNMNLTNTMEELRVSDMDRKVPLYLNFRQKTKETVTLNVPDGCRIIHVPKGASGGVDGLWSYKISYKVDRKNNTVTMTRDIDLNTMKITPDRFAENNKLVNELVKQYKETVVLTAK